MPRATKPRPLFAETYRPVRLPWSYRPLAAAVMLLALLQPLVYFGTIAVVGFGVVWWARAGFEIVGLGSGQRMGFGYRIGAMIALFRLCLYMTPLIGGVFVLLVLVGSLIPSRSERLAPGYPLARIEHPLIYAYVDKLCDIMGAPRPHRIDLSTDANASASLGSGILWLIRPRLVLTIGGTLAAGMSRSELTGVIAHELGHFTQGIGMRSTRIVGGINTWFMRVVHERGVLDDYIEDMRGSEYLFGAIAIAGVFATAAVALVRRFVLLVAAGSRLVTLAMSRRMEFAADGCQTRVAGSAAFVTTSARLCELTIGYGRALEIARHESTRCRLPENLSLLAVEVTPRLERDGRGFVPGMSQEPSLWRTHPPLDERARRATELLEPGILLSDGPAVKLFKGFERLTRDASRYTLEQALGDGVSAYRMMPLNEVLGRGKFAPSEAMSQAQALPGPKNERTMPMRAADEDVIPFAE